MFSINFEQKAMERRVSETVDTVKKLAGKPVPADMLVEEIGVLKAKFTGFAKIIIRPPEYIAMGGHFLPERKEVFAKIRWKRTFYRKPGSSWIRVA